MTSFDGGDVAGNDDSPSGGPADGGRRNAAARGPAPHEDDDPARLAPPVDPWLTEAATSVLGDATPSQGAGAAAVPPADTAPFTGTVHFGDRPPPADPSAGWGDDPRRRRGGRRATRWVVAVLTACAVFVAGMLAIDQFGRGGDGDALRPEPSTGATAGDGTARNRTPTAGPPAAPVGGGDSTGVALSREPSATTGDQPGSSAGAAEPGASADAGAPEVVYEVTASGSRNVGSVSYIDRDGDIIRLNGIPLPWRLAFPARPQRKPLVLIAQRKGGGDAGPVTCTITVDGKLLSSTTAEGRYAAPQCSGSG